MFVEDIIVKPLTKVQRQLEEHLKANDARVDSNVHAMNKLKGDSILTQQESTKVEETLESIKNLLEDWC